MNWNGSFSADYYANWFGVANTPTPPIPPAPTPVVAKRGGGYPGEAKHHRPWTEYEAQQAQDKIMLEQDAMDEEEIAIILTSWLNIK